MTKQQLFEHAVIQCKKLVAGRKSLKYKIAKISLEVVPYKVLYTEYTVAEFAKRIGVAPKTLNSWRKEYLFVISKLGEKTPDIDKRPMDRLALDTTLKQVTLNTPPKKVRKIYKDITTKGIGRENVYILASIKRLKTIDTYINHKAPLARIDLAHLRRALVLCNSISAGIEEFLDNKSQFFKNRKNKKEKRDLDLIKHINKI